MKRDLSTDDFVCMPNIGMTLRLQWCHVVLIMIMICLKQVDAASPLFSETLCLQLSLLVSSNLTAQISHYPLKKQTDVVY